MNTKPLTEEEISSLNSVLALEEDGHDFSFNNNTIARLLATISTLRDDHEALLDGRNAALQRAEQAEAACAVLVEATKPFAELGRQVGDGVLEGVIWPDATVIEGARAYHDGKDHVITIGDLRRAAEASLPQSTRLYMERVKKLEQNQRTPGTREICSRCQKSLHAYKIDGCSGTDDEPHDPLPDCPIRQPVEVERG